MEGPLANALLRLEWFRLLRLEAVERARALEAEDSPDQAKRIDNRLWLRLWQGRGQHKAKEGQQAKQQLEIRKELSGWVDLRVGSCAVTLCGLEQVFAVETN